MITTFFVLFTHLQKDNVPIREKPTNYIGEGAQPKRVKPFVPIPSTG